MIFNYVEDRNEMTVTDKNTGETCDLTITITRPFSVDKTTVAAALEALLNKYKP